MSACADGEIDIYYDGKCPVCRSAMRKVRARLAPGASRCIDIASDDFDASRHDLDPREVRRTLHVRLPDGEVVRGIDAVIVLWDRIGGCVGRLGCAGCRLACGGWRGVCFFARHRHLLLG